MKKYKKSQRESKYCLAERRRRRQTKAAGCRTADSSLVEAYYYSTVTPYVIHDSLRIITVLYSQGSYLDNNVGPFCTTSIIKLNLVYSMHTALPYIQ